MCRSRTLCAASRMILNGELDHIPEQMFWMAVQLKMCWSGTRKSRRRVASTRETQTCL